MGNKSHTRKSAIIFAGQGLSQIIRFLTNLLLAWFLLPADFGITAIVITIVTGLTLFSDVGIADCIIRHEKGATRAYYKTAQWLMLIRATSLYLLLVIIAPYIEDFYQVEHLTEYLRWGGLSLFLDGFLSARTFVLRRDMQVVKITLLELVPQFITSVLLVIGVMIYPSVWILISAMNVRVLIHVIQSQIWVPNLISFADYHNKIAVNMISFGKWIMLSTIFTYVITQSDRLILAKLSDVTEVGVYHLAMAIAGILYTISAKLIDDIIYPTACACYRDGNTSTLQADVESSLGGFLPLLYGVALMTFAISPVFFTTLYKADYAAAGSIAQLLATILVLMMGYFFFSKIIIALGKPNFAAGISAIVAVLRIALSIIGYRYAGVEGFILGMGIGTIAGIVVSYVWLNVNHGIHFSKITRSILFTSSLMIVLYFSRNLFADEVMYNWILAAVLPIGVMIYLYHHYGVQLKSFLHKQAA